MRGVGVNPHSSRPLTWVVATSPPVKFYPSQEITLLSKKRIASRSWHCLLVIAAAFVLPIPGPGIAAPQGPIGSESATTETTNTLLNVVNTERSARGLNAVSRNEFLERAAQWMADDMARHHTLNHADSRHRNVAARLEAFGYNRARLMAENIAEGQQTPAAVVKAWLQSPPHGANLLHADVEEAGVGHAVDPQGRHYWVLDLGARFTDR